MKAIFSLNLYCKRHTNDFIFTDKKTQNSKWYYNNLVTMSIDLMPLKTARRNLSNLNTYIYLHKLLAE